MHQFQIFDVIRRKTEAYVVSIFKSRLAVKFWFEHPKWQKLRPFEQSGFESQELFLPIFEVSETQIFTGAS